MLGCTGLCTLYAVSTVHGTCGCALSQCSDEAGRTFGKRGGEDRSIKKINIPCSEFIFYFSFLLFSIFLCGVVGGKEKLRKKSTEVDNKRELWKGAPYLCECRCTRGFHRHPHFSRLEKEWRRIERGRDRLDCASRPPDRIFLFPLLEGDLSHD